MRLPRWLVWTLLSASVLAVLGASAWLWVTWPDRTARTFFGLLQYGDVGAINAMLVPGTAWPETDWMNNAISGDLNSLVLTNDWEDASGGRVHRMIELRRDAL